LPEAKHSWIEQKRSAGKPNQAVYPGAGHDFDFTNDGAEIARRRFSPSAVENGLIEVRKGRSDRYGPAVGPGMFAKPDRDRHQRRNRMM
jgi:hypothetical protein